LANLANRRFQGTLASLALEQLTRSFSIISQLRGSENRKNAANPAFWGEIANFPSFGRGFDPHRPMPPRIAASETKANLINLTVENEMQAVLRS
jgi:hypothetical protein